MSSTETNSVLLRGEMTPFKSLSLNLALVRMRKKIQPIEQKYDIITVEDFTVQRASLFQSKLCQNKGY